jgi:vacuolar-type H+-ATPase subunit H
METKQLKKMVNDADKEANKDIRKVEDEVRKQAKDYLR